MNIQNNLTTTTVPQQAELLTASQCSLQSPIQATSGRHANDETSSNSSSVVLVPGIDRLTTQNGSTGSTRIGESLEALRLANKELEASV